MLNFETMMKDIYYNGLLTFEEIRYYVFQLLIFNYYKEQKNQ
jgi:hypothetical protein